MGNPTPPPSSPIRVSKAQLFTKLGYTPHPGQALVHASTASRRVLCCGARWGKSTCGAMEAAAAALEPRENSLGWIAAPTIDLADRVFIPAVDAIQTAFKHRIKYLNLRERHLVVVNLGGGVSEIRGKSCDHPVGLLGAAIDWIIIDEAARLRDDIWPGFLGPRLVDRRGWALFLSTPQGTNWFFGLYRRGQKNRDPMFESWSSPSSENPHIGADVIAEEQERLAPDVFAQEYGAVFLGSDIDPCDLCHGPARNACSALVLGPGEVPKLCPECGDYVDDDGRTVVPLWGNKRGQVMIVHLEPRAGEGAATP